MKVACIVFMHIATTEYLVFQEKHTIGLDPLRISCSGPGTVLVPRNRIHWVQGKTNMLLVRDHKSQAEVSTEELSLCYEGITLGTGGGVVGNLLKAFEQEYDRFRCVPYEDHRECCVSNELQGGKN